MYRFKTNFPHLFWYDSDTFYCPYVLTCLQLTPGINCSSPPIPGRESLSVGHAGRHVSNGMSSSPDLKSIVDPSSDGQRGKSSFLAATTMQSNPGIKSSAPLRSTWELLCTGQAGRHVS